MTYRGCQASGPWSSGLWASRDHSRAERPFISCQLAPGPEQERGGCGAPCAWRGFGSDAGGEGGWGSGPAPGTLPARPAYVHSLLLPGIAQCLPPCLLCRCYYPCSVAAPRPARPVSSAMCGGRGPGTGPPGRPAPPESGDCTTASRPSPASRTISLARRPQGLAGVKRNTCVPNSLEERGVLKTHTAPSSTCGAR